MATMALRMIIETLFRLTLTRFFSYQVASRLPSEARTRVRCARGSVVRSSGRLSMPLATLRAPKPVTAAKGSAMPATSAPISAATATITPRWETTRDAVTWSGRDGMAQAYVTEGDRPRYNISTELQECDF